MERSGCKYPVSFEDMDNLCKRFRCEFASDYSFVVFRDWDTHTTVDVYFLFFDGDKDAFIGEFSKYNDPVDVDDILDGDYDMLRES